MSVVGRTKRARLPNAHRPTSGTLTPKHVRDLYHQLHQQRGNQMKQPEPDVAVITEDDLTIEHGHPDERFAGTPLDSWRGYHPFPSVITAIEHAIAKPGVAMIAYCHDLPDDPYRMTDNHQRRAARAWIAEHHPHLKISVGTEVVPFRGLGSDCRVFKVSVGVEKRSR